MAIRYITQIKATELDNMLAAGNMRPGPGIKIDRQGESFVIGIDEKAIIDIVWCFIKSGQVLPSAPCSLVNSAKVTRDAVCTDPSFYGG